MDPSTASTVFRELLQTPDNEITMFARRAGLRATFTAEDLLKARELLEALAEALGTGASRDWEAVRAAFAGLRSKRNPYLLGSSPSAVAYSSSATSSSEPQPPPLVNRVVVAKPTLGDPAPGTAQHAEHARGRFVPSAKGRAPVADPSASTPPGPAPMPGPLAAYPAAVQPSAGGILGPEAAPWPGQPAAPAVVGAAAAPPAQASPWQPAGAPGQAPDDPQGSPWASDRSSGAAAWAPSRVVGTPPSSSDDGWHKPLPAMPEALAPVGASSRDAAAGGPFTRAEVGPQAATSAPVPAQGAGLAPGAPPGPPAAAAYVGGAPGASAQPPAKPPPPPRRPPPQPAAGLAAAESAAQPAEAAAGGSVYESVARYAAFCAACAEFPDRLQQTLAGYGLSSEAERARIDSLWQDRFDDDPELLGRWEQLFAGFRKSLRS